MIILSNLFFTVAAANLIGVLLNRPALKIHLIAGGAALAIAIILRVFGG